MRNIVVAGIGTDVGKTIVSAVLVEALGGDYWKPVHCGLSGTTDAERVKSLVTDAEASIHPEAYRLRAEVSPHQGSKMEGIAIDPAKLSLPKTARPLIIEMCGGIQVPITLDNTLSDVMNTWDADWILVSRNYLGSINHTLLSHHFLQSKKKKVLGIVFNGVPQPDSEQVIQHLTKLPVLGRINEEPILNKAVIKKYATALRSHVAK